MRMPLVILPLLLASALAAFAADSGKNVFDVVWRDSDDAPALSSDPKVWDFGFRPYGAGADRLVSDPRVIRAAAEGGDTGGDRPTALSVSFNERGLDVFVACFGPPLEEALAATNAAPLPRLEFFIAPGDADSSRIEPYWMMVFRRHPPVEEFPALEYDRDYRPLAPYVTASTVTRRNAVIVKLHYAWEGLFDRLPFLTCDKRDVFWRLSMIRWDLPGGGRTWGGQVHRPDEAGYIRFPRLTEEQENAIMSQVLVRAWESFTEESVRYELRADGDVMSPQVDASARVREELRRCPRTYVNYGEDPAMRPALERLVAERKALGPAIARFRELPRTERAAFYRRACDMLFNFRLDVERTHAAILAEKLDGIAGKEAGR